VLVVALCSGWLIQYHLVGGVITCSDFSEYCQSTAALRDGELHLFSHNRSIMAAWPTATLARHLGVIDGMAYAAVIFTGVVGAGVYLWGRAIHSRLVGVLAALAFGTVGPLVILPRTISYYPETSSVFVFSAAGAALALRYRTWPALLAGGVGAGLAFLIDVRGLFWALPALGLSLLACVPVEWRVPKAWARLPLRLALVLLPVAVSYPLGRYSFQPTNWTLEQQVSGFRRDRLLELGLEDPQTPLNTGYLWGYSDPLEIPASLRAILELQADMPEAIAQHPDTVWGRWAHIEPWYKPLGACLALAVAALWWRPWQLIALLGTLVPFAVVLRSAGQSLIHLRFLQTPMLGFPVLLAMGFAGLALARLWPPADERKQRTFGRFRWRLWARPGAAVLLAVLIVTGLAPTWISPVAVWRWGWTVDEPLGRMIREAAVGPPRMVDQDYACHQAMYKDVHEDGHPPGSRLYKGSANQGAGGGNGPGDRGGGGP
jgi:hypothetical protein